MKFMNTPATVSLTRKITLILALVAFSFASLVANAHPYAAGNVSFIMNEAGATVDVVFNDGTTNHMGVLPQGSTNFNIGAHTSFRIISFKTGNGLPSLISSDTNTFSIWN